MKQLWRTIPEHPNYQVSNFGRVRHQLSDGSSRQIQPRQYGNGYTGVKLRGTEFYTHRLVATVFVGTIATGWQVNHLNGIKIDNRLENLEIVTPAENMQHAHWPEWYRTQTKMIEFIEV